MAPNSDVSSKVILPRGYLPACLLLLLSESGSYGYDLFGQLYDLGLLPAGPGVVYRALHEMEDLGLVVSEREQGDRRPDRRTYEPTPAGLERLAGLANEIRAVEDLLSVYDSRVEELAKVVRGRRAVAA